MKKIIPLLFLFISIHSNAQEICVSNGISTNPDNAVNADAPIIADGGTTSEFINDFNWYNNNGLTLAQYALNDMFAYNANQFNMSHPYSNANGYSYLTSPALEDLDIYPEDGWELLSVNLGSFPNGTLLSNTFVQGVPIQSEFPEIPYLLLYNKNRGIIRLFANSLTGLNNSQFDTVVITLIFVDPSLQTSGLLRHNNGYDLALDQETVTASVISNVVHPNNPTHWFHADFQVGYDPCTCIYRSDISLLFRFIENTEIRMTANSIYTEVPLIDANGHTTIPQDFLTGVSYEEDFEGSGILIYQSMGSMIDDYIERLEAVEAHNDLVGASSDEVKRKKFILKTLQQIVISGATSISGPLAIGISTFATNLIQSIGINGTITIKKDVLLREGKNLLGQGFDWLSKEWLTEPQSTLATPTMPTATISTTTFDGDITSNTDVMGPSLYNPGTYPNAQGLPAISAHNYPVYNEVLGLFALLKTPQIVYTKDYSEEVLEYDYVQILDGPDELTKKTKRTSIIKILQEEGFKYAFNPAAGIDMENVRIDASLVVKYASVEKPQFSTWVDFTFPGANPLCWRKKAFPNQFSRTIHVDNMFSDSYDTNPLSVQLEDNEQIIYASPFFPIESFSTLVTGFTLENIEKWSVKPCTSGGNEADRIEAYHTIVAGQDLDPLNLVFEIKLIVNMPFLQPGHNGQMNSTTQVFTYQIPSSHLADFSDDPGTYLIPWSVTNNPVGGTQSLQPVISFQTKEWNLNDNTNWGGYSGPITSVHATDQISILGNQTLIPEIEGVQFVARNEIMVAGEASLVGDFVLKLEDFVQMISLPNPPVDAVYLESYCANEGPVPYNANHQRQSGQSATSHQHSAEKKSYKESKVQLFPNPASDKLNLRVSNMSGNIEFTIINSVGVLVSKQLRKVENSFGVTNISFDISNLPEGS